MSSASALMDLFPAMAAGVVGALAARRHNRWERLGVGLIAALVVAMLMWLWPRVATSPADPVNQPTEWPHLLNVLIGLPLVGGLLIAAIPRRAERLLKSATLTILLADLALSLVLLRTPMGSGWHFVFIHDWIPALGIRYHVAIDGISLWLVLLTTFITPIAAYVSFGSIQARIKDLCFSFLLLQATMIGAFVALDLFLFYVFWELILVPMYVMIGVWGSAERVKAALKFFLFTMAGSVLLLAAMLYIVHTYARLAGQPSFDYLALSKVVLPKNVQLLCFWAFAFAFFVKVPMWPVHTWLPDAHVQAPTGGSIVLAAVMLKLGTYAYMRFAMGLFPFAAGTQSATLAGIAVGGGILYGALCSWKQDDMKRLIAYSSVAHLGYVMLGLFAASVSSMQGAVLQMINHGVSTGALFLLVGVIYDRRHTRRIEDFGGLAKVMPVYAALFVVITLASIGVPGTNGFVGEFLVIMGTYGSEKLGKYGGIDAVAAAAGVILAAIYMLSVVQRVFFGPVTREQNKGLQDLNARELIALTPLVLMVFAIGLFPSVFTSRIGDAVFAFEERTRLMWMAGQDVGGAAKLLTVEQIAAQLPGADQTLERLKQHDVGAPAVPTAEVAK